MSSRGAIVGGEQIDLAVEQVVQWILERALGSELSGRISHGVLDRY